MASCWVEVSQQRSVVCLDALALLLRPCPLSVDVVCDHSLNCELGVSVWVGWAQRALFWNWDHVRESGRIAVHGRGGREDDVGDIVLLHAAEQAECAVDVDIVVVEWDLGALSHCLQRGEVDDIVDVWVLVEDSVQRLLVRNIDLLVLWSLSADELDAVEDLVGGVVEVVDNDDLVVGFEKRKGGERANVARATIRPESVTVAGNRM